MSVSPSTPSMLLDLLEHSPGGRIAIILPEQNLSVTYGALRSQVWAVAEQLAAAGVGRGDRVGIALPNGLPMIVSFLAASAAGTAAAMTPTYKEDEFRFYLEDTAARVLILPPDKTDGTDAARRAAGGGVPVCGIELAGAGSSTLSGGTAPRSCAPAAVDDVALVLHTSGSSGRPKRVPL